MLYRHPWSTAGMALGKPMPGTCRRPPAAMGGGGTIRMRGEGRTVPAIVLHGDADRTVNPVTVIAQAGRGAALTKTPKGALCIAV
jgi:hypothetical protein